MTAKKDVLKAQKGNETYLLRLYRKKEEGANPLVGVVEEIGSDEKAAFHSLYELGLILSKDGSDLSKNGKIERRGFHRLKLKLPVLVKGKDFKGNAFVELTKTEDLSAGGALFLLKNRVENNERLRVYIEPYNSSISVEVRVVRVADACKWKGVGVAFEKAL